MRADKAAAKLPLCTLLIRYLFLSIGYILQESVCHTGFLGLWSQQYVSCWSKPMLSLKMR